MSYQFIHIEDYGINISKKRSNNGTSEKYKKETKLLCNFFTLFDIFCKERIINVADNFLQTQYMFIIFCYIFALWKSKNPNPK